MKKMTIYIILVAFSYHGQSQIDTGSCLSKSTELQLKSKNQKNAGWVALGGGSALLIGGYFLGTRNESSFAEAGAGAIMGTIGVISMLGSVPLFIGSGRNKRRAAAILSLNVERLPDFIQTGPEPMRSETLQLKIKLPFRMLFSR